MARRKTAVGPGQNFAAWSVLAVLALSALWVGLKQADFSPAVLTALSAPGTARSSAASSPLGAFLPAGVEGFSPVGGPEFFSPETLPDKIDGKAELYLAANFKELACQRLTAGAGGFVEVFLYAMAEPTDAFSVFSAQRRPGGTRLDLTEHGYLAGNALFLASGPYYAEFVADSQSPGTAERLTSLAKNLLDRLPKTQGVRDDSSLFPAQGLAPDTVQLLASDAFGMQGLGGVYCAAYRLASGEGTAFLSRRASEAEARGLVRDYAKFILDNGGKELPLPAGAPLGARLLDALGDIELIFAQGSYLAGVHAASSPEAALELALNVSTSLGATPREGGQ